jgi:histidine ammonia-lyase
MARQPIRIANQALSLSDLRAPLSGPCEVRLEPQARQALMASHKAIAELLQNDEAIYGVNTGGDCRSIWCGRMRRAPEKRSVPQRSG